MKYLLYAISGSLILIWSIVFWGSNSFEAIDMLLILAGLFILIRIMLNKNLSTKVKF